MVFLLFNAFLCHDNIDPDAADDIQFLLGCVSVRYKGIHLLHGTGDKKGFLSKFTVVHKRDVAVRAGNELAFDIHHGLAEFRDTLGGNPVGASDEQVNGCKIA